jgi:RNA polymerase sigma-70 factor (ECF subfamily)
MLPLKNARFLKKGQLIDCMPNMELLKLGDAREFKKLFELHAPRLLNTALYLLGNRQDAEDVTQEVFKSIYIGLPQFKEESSVHTWMHRITLNKCNEFLRAKNRKKRKGILLSLFDSLPIETTETPELMFILKEAEWSLWKQIQSLPEKQRIAMTLYAMDDLSYKEIASIMSVSVASIESLLFRARTKLKTHQSNED